MAKVAALIFLYHLSYAAIGKDIPSVDQTVQHLGRLLDQIGLVRVVVYLIL